MLLSDLKKLRNLREKYAHDLAVAKQQTTFDTPEEELKTLAVFHLSNTIVSGLDEFFETIGDEAPGLIQAVALLEGAAGGIVGCRTSGKPQLAEQAFEVGNKTKFQEFQKYRSIR